MVFRDLWFYEIVPGMKKGKKPESRIEPQDMPTRRSKIYGDHDIKDKITRCLCSYLVNRSDTLPLCFEGICEYLRSGDSESQKLGFSRTWLLASSASAGEQGMRGFSVRSPWSLKISAPPPPKHFTDVLLSHRAVAAPLHTHRHCAASLSCQARINSFPKFNERGHTISPRSPSSKLD